MYSGYFKLLFVFLLGLFLQTQTFAQSNLQNLLAQMPDNNISETSFWVEKDDYFYFISRQQGGPVNPIRGIKASRYYINKYDKHTLQRVNQRYIAGDTLQNDSLVFASYIALKNDRFHLYYPGSVLNDDTTYQRYYFYQCVDMDFNVLAPEKRIEDSSMINEVSYACVEPMDNGNFFIGFWPPDNPTPRTNYLILDSMGNTILMGEVAHTEQGLGPMRDFTPMGNHTYLVSGYGFAGLSDVNPEANNFGWCLVNDSMQTLDTFRDKYGLVQDPVALSYFQRPGTVALPGGSLVTATGTAYVQGALSGDSDYPLIRKHAAASRYGIDKMVVSGPVDNTDTAHENGWIPVSVMYNPYDNTIYYASVTHMNFYGLLCADNNDKSYLEVISLDTNLNVKWKRYFKMSGICSKAMGIVSPDGRPGVIITGFNTFFEKSKYIIKDWVYYINDATPSDSLPTAVNEINVTAQGFKIYPNPAHDIVQISVENTTLRSVAICDITGWALLNKCLSKAAESIDISALVKGIYILRCEDKEGRVFVSKVVKE